MSAAVLMVIGVVGAAPGGAGKRNFQKEQDFNGSWANGLLGESIFSQHNSAMGRRPKRPC